MIKIPKSACKGEHTNLEQYQDVELFGQFSIIEGSTHFKLQISNLKHFQIPNISNFSYMGNISNEDNSLQKNKR